MEDDEIDWKKIEKIDQQISIPFKKPIEILTNNGIEKSPGIHYNGYKEIYDIEFEDGNIYSFTGNHKLLIKTLEGKEEWKCVEDLNEKDEIVHHEINDKK
jgi:intein/homing endonuclease